MSDLILQRYVKIITALQFNNMLLVNSADDKLMIIPTLFEENMGIL